MEETLKLTSPPFLNLQREKLSYSLNLKAEVHTSDQSRTSPGIQGSELCQPHTHKKKLCPQLKEG